MNDFAFVAIILASFALLALFVTACDRIIGSDEDSTADVAGSSAGPGQAA